MTQSAENNLNAYSTYNRRKNTSKTLDFVEAHLLRES